MRLEVKLVVSEFKNLIMKRTFVRKTYIHTISF